MARRHLAQVLPGSGRALLSAVAVIVCSGGGSTGAAPTTEAEQVQRVYQLKATDSVRELAARFLGGEEFLPELLAYNRVSNPLELGDGSFIGIPGEERVAALAAIEKANEATRLAIAAAAQTYALDELKAAREGVDAANAARGEALYAKASELARKATEKGTLAKRLADERAPVSEPGTLSVVFGDVQVAPAGSTTFASAKSGDPLPVGSRVRTAHGARAEVRLPDGSMLQILESSVFRIKQSRRDRRDQRRDVQLDVIMGSLLGNIPKRNHARSTYRLSSRKATIAIRGTEMRVGNDELSVSRLSVLTGLAEFTAGEKTTPVPENFGSYAKVGEAARKPVKLLPAPQMLVPGRVERRTAQQRIPFDWAPLKTRRFDLFHLELSQDASFNTIVEEIFTKGDEHITRPLTDGDYYWRISTIDGKGMEGKCQHGKVAIHRRVEVAFEKADGSRLRAPAARVGLGERIRAVPASLDSSIVEMELSLDGVSFWKFWEPTGRFVPTRPGPMTLYARGVDAFGERGPVAQQTVQVTPDAR